MHWWLTKHIHDRMGNVGRVAGVWEGAEVMSRALPPWSEPFSRSGDGIVRREERRRRGQDKKVDLVAPLFSSPS